MDGSSSSLYSLSVLAMVMRVCTHNKVLSCHSISPTDSARLLIESCRQLGLIAATTAISEHQDTSRGFVHACKSGVCGSSVFPIACS